MKEIKKKSQYDSTKIYTKNYNKLNINVQLNRELVRKLRDKIKDKNLSLKEFLEIIIMENI